MHFRRTTRLRLVLSMVHRQVESLHHVRIALIDEITVKRVLSMAFKTELIVV